MENQLLTYDEIQSVLIESLNPIYKVPNLLFIPTNKSHLSIVKISEKGLIFIEGNIETGFKHICKRHNYYDIQDYWIDDKLDKPTLFSKEFAPIYHLSLIADDIYINQNLNNDKNKDKEKFDLYKGVSEVLGKRKINYILLVYKNSKVVHTLYPDDDKSKRKRVRHFNYVKGVVSYSYNIKQGIVTYQMPYFKKKIELYRIIIRRNHYIGKEYVYLQVNSFIGIPIVAYLKLEGNIEITDNIDHHRYADYLNFDELLHFQKLIVEFEEWYNSK